MRAKPILSSRPSDRSSNNSEREWRRGNIISTRTSIYLAIFHCVRVIVCTVHTKALNAPSIEPYRIVSAQQQKKLHEQTKTILRMRKYRTISFGIILKLLEGALPSTEPIDSPRVCALWATAYERGACECSLFIATYVHQPWNDKLFAEQKNFNDHFICITGPSACVPPTKTQHVFISIFIRYRKVMTIPFNPPIGFGTCFNPKASRQKVLHMEIDFPNGA